MHPAVAPMPIISSQFRPPWFLRNGHVQTILPVLLPRRIRVKVERTRWELPDGDFLDLDWARRGRKDVAILSHGLEGCSGNGYVRGMTAALVGAGWDVLAWNFRGCGGEPNRLPRFYHSGETGDLAAVTGYAASMYERIALIGYSLGGNMTLKYLGEARPHPAVVAGCGISVPIDLAASSRALDQRWENRIYLSRFIKTLVAKVREKAGRFPGQFDVTGAEDIRTFAQFDDRYTAPLHGFRDAEDYWARSSARQYLRGITVPTLLLNAQDDPFLAPECFPYPEATGNAALFLEAPVTGGHVGFLDLEHGMEPWSERRVLEFLASVTRPRAPLPPAM
jgi:predicted alpha/beta-fold hydrolase